MSTPELDTVYLHHCVDRWRSGERGAADELLRAAGVRLEHLARRMLRSFPNVRGWADTNDVLQGSLLRLLNTLRNLQPNSTRHFFNLAALHIRRELLDLARQVATRGRTAPTGDDADRMAEVTDGCPSEDDLERWRRFHEAVEALPGEEREVLGLTFYHGFSQQQIAELFGVSERTVRRRWQDACVELNRLVGGDLPES